MDISVVRHAVRAADRALSIAAKAWAWLIRPSSAYPQPPHPSDSNARGLGWSGHERFKPFTPPAPQLKQPTVHENIDARPPSERRAEAGRPPSDLGLGLGQFGGLGGPAVVGVPLIWPAGNPEDPE